MGYNTEYSLDVIGSLTTTMEVSGKDKDGNPAIIYQDLNLDIEDLKRGIAVLYYNNYSPFEESTKWYNHEKNMRNFSTHYPHLVFVLKGVGEDYPDIWVKYFKNGKMQKAKAAIVYPDFDEGRLV